MPYQWWECGTKKCDKKRKWSIAKKDPVAETAVEKKYECNGSSTTTTERLFHPRAYRGRRSCAKGLGFFQTKLKINTIVVFRSKTSSLDKSWECICGGTVKHYPVGGVSSKLWI